MTDKDMVERVDMKTEFSKMSAAQQHFIKKAEGIARTRALKQKTLRKRNLMVAGGLLTVVAAIYTYTISAVKQEKFLDEFDKK